MTEAAAATMDEHAGARAELERLTGPFFAALRQSALSVVVTNPLLHDNPVFFVNDAFTKMTGYELPDVVGRNCRLLQGPATDRTAVREIAAAIGAQRQIDTQIVNYRKDGMAFWNRMFIAPIMDAYGRLQFFFSSQLDVSASHHAQSVAADLQARQDRMLRVNESLQGISFRAGAPAIWEWYIPEQKLTGDVAFASHLGLSAELVAEGVSPQHFFANIHPLDRDRIRLSVGAMLRGAELFSKEFRVFAADGAMRWVHGNGRCRYDAADRPCRFDGILIDVTDQKRLESQLRIAQSAGGVGTFEHVTGFATATVSPQFCDLLGLRPAAELPVRTINAVVRPGDPPLIDEGEDAFVSHKRDEFRIIRPDTREERWLVRRGEHMEDAETTGARFSGVIYDITEAKRTETALRTLNETLESRVAERTRERDRIWRVSPDLLGVAAPDGIWLSINPAWQKLLGWGDADIIDRDFTWLEHPDDEAATHGRFARAAAALGTYTFENRLRQSDGAYRWLSWTAVPEMGLVYCVGRDVTLERETAAALRLAEDKLRQSQKMEAVGQLTGGIAHDFNNLLAGITGSLEVMQTRVAQGRMNEIDRYIESAQGAAKRAAALTHRLLAFSRQQTLDPRPIDLNHLVGSMEELVRRTVGLSIDVNDVDVGATWLCFADVNQLENALLNLCINARDAMQGGGTLTISTSNVTLTSAEARDVDLPLGDYLTLSVADTGTGMAQDVIARAFDPFFTTKPIGQGTGLGLSMIYGFARQSGGQARIASQIGRGTIVTIYLPRFLGVTEDAARAAEPRPEPNGGRGERVLVVDDEPTVRMLLTEVLEDLGYDSIDAADGAAALQVLQSDTEIDLLITDVGLPGGLNGRQMATMGRALRPDLKILFITGYAEATVLHHGDLEPGMYMLTKPFALDTLANRVKQIISQD